MTTRAPRRAPPKTESSEQIRFVGRVRHFYPDVVIFAVPNGGGRSPMEATKLKEEGVLAGVSDLVVLEARDGYFGLFIEMKRTKGGTVSPEQDAFMKKARARGYKAIVAEGCDEAWRQLESYMAKSET